MKFETYTCGNPAADWLLIQPVDGHDLEMLEQEISYIREMNGGQDFCLKALKVNDWNKDLAPWPAPPVFGKEDFGDGAGRTLAFILNEVIPEADLAYDGLARKYLLGGYSLAGLFAVWAGYQTELFSGIAAASPSVWFPGFSDYMRERRMLVKDVYLSLGDKEEKARNPLMARVGDAIREGASFLERDGINCILEWNQGNHFKEADLRTAKAFSWVMKRRHHKEVGL